MEKTIKYIVVLSILGGVYWYLYSGLLPLCLGGQACSIMFSNDILLTALKNSSVLLFILMLVKGLQKRNNQRTGETPLSDVYANPDDSVTVGFRKFKNPEYKLFRMILAISLIESMVFLGGVLWYIL